MARTGLAKRRTLAALALAAGLMLCVRTVSAQTTDALLDTLQHTGFQYFWSEANPANGLIRDRDTGGSPCSIAATGFGLSAICVGVDHGWVSRADARARVLTTLQTFWLGPQGISASGTIGYRGLYYHFLDMGTATRTWDSELSTIDTALLFAGILDAKQYFSTSDADEVTIRALADSIYQRADWNFMRNFNTGILMGWKPGTGFNNFGQWIGYNEAMILYILALGSPTHAVPTTAWSAWTSGYKFQTLYGYSFVTCPPLFTHQYSHCWVDFRYIWDPYMQARNMTYFENSRRATYAQRAYCIANPGSFVGYGDSLWGLTACDGPPPTGYNARGAPPAQNDDGTIAPTATAGSIAFAPEIAIPVLRNLWNTYRNQLWTWYGFVDAFNLTAGWSDLDVLGIDQGPIVLMIENYRTQAVWTRLMQNADIQRGLDRAGFVVVPNTGVALGDPPDRDALFQNAPNPFRDETVIRYRLATAGRVRLTLYDVRGREVEGLINEVQGAGPHALTLRVRRLPDGIYSYRLHTPAGDLQKKCLLLRN